MDDDKGVFSEAHAALDRMRRAHKRGTGCHLTAEMIDELSLTVVGSLWDDGSDQTAPAPCATEEK